MKPRFGLAVGTKLAVSKVSDHPRVRGEDVGQCIQAFALPAAELIDIDNVHGVECQRGRHSRERTVVRTPDLMWRWDTMVTNISSVRLLMKSTFAGGSCCSGIHFAGMNYLLIGNATETVSQIWLNSICSYIIVCVMHTVHSGELFLIRKTIEMVQFTKMCVICGM